MKRLDPRARSGFSLTELFVFLIVILAVGALAMPGLYRTRPLMNEEGAVDVLHMLASAQNSYEHATGGWARLYQIKYAPGAESNDLEPFLPFLSGSADMARYGGYLFRDVLDQNGRLVGCSAQPLTPPFSGRQQFELSYATGQIKTLESDQLSASADPN